MTTPDLPHPPDLPPPGSSVFEIDDSDLPPSLVQYQVVRYTPSIMLVKLMSRDGQPTKRELERKWNKKRIGRSVFGSARAALEAYASNKDAEAKKHRREAERNEEVRDWARARIAQIAEGST